MSTWKKYTGGYKLDVYGKGICKNIVFKQNAHSTDVNASSDYWLYTHTHTPRADTNRIVVFGCMCVGYNYVNFDNNIWNQILDI